MNSFTLTAVGNLARNPELVAKGDVAYTRFCLVGNDYAGKDEEGAPREIVTTLWFVAFGPMGETLVRNSRKGDQLIVEARVRANTWTDKQGEKQYDHDFVVQGFRFGAPGKVKREEREARREDGLQRGDERGNGRDNNANAGEEGNGSMGANGSGSASGASAARLAATPKAGGADGKITAGIGPDPGAKPGMHAKSAGADGKVGAGVVSDSDTQLGPDANVAANARGTANTGANEKPGVNRAGRKAAAPPP
jgi:single-strand DNA-binding protein